MKGEPVMMVTVPIEAVVVRHRIRSSLGDLTSLQESIRQVGLLHPPAVRRDGEALVLVAGQRRLEACKAMEWSEIPVRVCDDIRDELDAMQAEAEENTCRLRLSPAELQANAVVLLPRATAAARCRMQLRAKDAEGKDTVLTFGQASDEVGRALGVSGRTLRRISRVYELATADAVPPERRRQAQEITERWGRGDGSITPGEAIRILHPRDISERSTLPRAPYTHRRSAATVLTKAAETLEGVCLGLRDVDPSGITDEQKTEFAQRIDHVMSELRFIRKQLRTTGEFYARTGDVAHHLAAIEDPTDRPADQPARCDGAS